MPEILTIMRKWGNPDIKLWIDTEEIGIQIKLDDFIEALINEVGSVTTILTRKQIRERIEKSSRTVIEAVKKETIKIVGG
jgi:hypothetical protein